MVTDDKKNTMNEHGKSVHRRLEKASVVINSADYDATDIVSTFKYAILKYGITICEESGRLKNIISDLSPQLSKENKLLILLSQSGYLQKMMNSCEWDKAELYIWIDNATSFLVHEEFIDEKIAYSFTRKILMGISGKKINNKYLTELPAKEKAKTEAFNKEENAKKSEVRVARRKSAVSAKQKEIEELKRKLADEEKARKQVEAQLAAEQLGRRIDQLKAKKQLQEEKAKNKQLIMPAGEGEYTSIEKIKKANPGKRIIVVKEGWTNDYCFAVEDFEGTIKAVGTRFLNGIPRGSSNDWMDRRHRKFKVYNGPSVQKIEEYYEDL